MNKNNQKFILFAILVPVFILADFLIFSHSSTEAISSFQQYFKKTSISLPVAEIKERETKFLFFGDIMLDRNVKKLIGKRGFDYLLASTSPEFYNNYNVVSANLEGAVTNAGEHYPPENGIDFAFHPEDVANFKSYNFNFFNLANNHFGDQGEKGIKETEDNLKNLGYEYFGCRDRQVGDCSLKISEINGQKIAFVGASMVYGVFDNDDLIERIKKIKSETDLVILNIHWGVEYDHQFNKVQQELAHKFIDAGVDIIIGHHPHVVQGVEIYKNKAIFYSLGNFIFDQYFSADTQEGMAIAISRKAHSTEFEIKPFKSKLSKISLLEGDERTKFLQRLNTYSFSDGLPAGLVDGKFEISNQ